MYDGMELENIVQTTLDKEFSLIGTGLHSGRPARLVVKPASAGHGIVFVRTDLTDIDNCIPARFDLVRDTRLCTGIANDDGVRVSTIEHLMAAFSGCGVHNALVEIDGPEIPIMDGSSVRFVHAILAAGVRMLSQPLQVMQILRPVTVCEGSAVARLEPCDGLEIHFRIDFEEPVIGVQSRKLDMRNGTFVRELSDCRTFCRDSDVTDMRAAGLALGGTLENAVVVDGMRVLSPGGFRRPDECVRHKMLDALGDLALAGAPVLGRYSGERAGHRLTNLLLRAVFAQPDSYAMIEANSTLSARLPGAGITKLDLDLAV